MPPPGTIIEDPERTTPYGVKAIYDNASLTKTTGGKGVRVAVFDTGVNKNHPDLADNIITCRTYLREIIQTNKCTDTMGHGTHVAGIIAANGGPNGEGIYGIAPEADLMIFKVCDEEGKCSTDSLNKAMIDAVDMGADIFSISLGGNETQEITDAIEYADRNGVLMISATGNTGPEPDTIQYPSADRRVISVGAADMMDKEGYVIPGNFRITDYSSRGVPGNEFRELDRYREVAAPGHKVISTWRNGDYYRQSGTSMAGPHIAGLAAKIWSRVDVGEEETRARAVRHELWDRAGLFDIYLGWYSRRGYDPSAGIGMPQVQVPNASINVSPVVPTEGEQFELRIDELNSDSEIRSIDWFLRVDMEIGQGMVVSHRIDEPGWYTVKLGLTDSDRSRVIVEHDLLVNDRPSIDVLGPSRAVVGRNTTLVVDVQDDFGAINVRWLLQDGTELRGEEVTHRFQKPGIHGVNVVVEDEYGASTSRGLEIDVGEEGLRDLFMEPLSAPNCLLVLVAISLALVIAMKRRS